MRTKKLRTLKNEYIRKEQRNMKKGFSPALYEANLVHITAKAMALEGGDKKKLKNLDRLLLQKGRDSGIFLGGDDWVDDGSFIGIKQEMEDNLIVIGSNGSGKSASIAMPTLEAWGGAICATDVKGELSGCYGHLYRCGRVLRLYLEFNPLNLEGSSYDPFWWLQWDGEENLINNIMEIVHAILPILVDSREPFCVESEQAVLAACLLYYYRCGLSFSEAICKIVAEPLSALCKQLGASGDFEVRANDTATQQYLCQAIGQRVHLRRSVSQNVDEFGKCVGYSGQISEAKDWLIAPHELVTLKQVLLLCPEGFFWIKKYVLQGGTMACRGFLGSFGEKDGFKARVFQAVAVRNENAEVLDMEKRVKNANSKVDAAEHKKRVQQREQQMKDSKARDRQKYVLGGLLVSHFPELCDIAPGKTNAESRRNFAEVEAFMVVLAEDVQLMQELKEKAKKKSEIGK